MKRKRLLAALLACAAATACAPVPSNTNTNANAANANANAANANSAAASWTDDDIIAGDRAAWDAIKRKDSAALSAVLAPEFVNVNWHGVSDRNGTVEYCKKLDLSEVNLSEFRVVRLDADAAIVLYRERSKGTYDGRPVPTGSAYHSTVTVLRGGKWTPVYHQSTLEMPPPPAPATPAATPTPAATASGSPAAQPAATTADAEANERLVWDALKRKDWDAFAGYLAEDALEVWGTGISGKAESVKGVRNVDFSTFEMSDLKTIPLDADAKIVTYTVKGVGPDRKPFTEYGSTLWAVRGGKWLAVFHQGTLATPPGA